VSGPPAPQSAPARRLTELLAPVAGDLATVEGWLQSQFEPSDEALQPLLAHLGRFRGKRLRAAQVLLVGRACGGLRPVHVAVAGIIEMIHAATLVHDDLLDGARQRRGQPCLHERWGAHAAVLLGDWVYARAFLRSTGLEDGLCSRVLAEATGRVCRGEILQNLSRGRFDLTEEEYMEQIDGKTGALYEAGGRLAAAYAGAPEEVAAAAAAHGRDAGRAFQMMDDLLDLTGDPERVRKSLGTDWAGGKMTLPLIRLRERLAPGLRRRLETAFQAGGDPGILRREPFRGPFEEAVEECRSEIRALLVRAASSLETLPAGPDRDALARLTEFLGVRPF